MIVFNIVSDNQSIKQLCYNLNTNLLLFWTYFLNESHVELVTERLVVATDARFGVELCEICSRMTGDLDLTLSLGFAAVSVLNWSY